jgi:probable UDP-sugar transporter A4
MTSQTELAVDRLNNSTLSLETLSSSEEKSNNASNRLAFRAMIFFQVLVCGSYSTLIHLCEHDGSITFSSTTMNSVIELVKLVFSLIAYFCSSTKTFSLISSAKSWFQHSLPYSIPSIFYFINNNLGVHMQLQMDPASYQILSNFKIATTAIFHRLIMKQKLSGYQWFAVTLLFFGGFFYSLGNVAFSNRRSSLCRVMSP